MHSQRLNDTKLFPWIILKVPGNVVASHCTCMAGLSACCSHVGAILFLLPIRSFKKIRSNQFYVVI